MVDPAFAVDLSKPVVFQVGHLGEAYDDWVHQPIVSKETPRFFENPVLELFTRTPWWVIPLFWLPVVCWFVTSSINDGLPPYHAAPAIFAGIIIYTLVEYFVHRFIFHMKTKSYWGNTVHYLIHGCHHKHPLDRLRLVYPPAAGVVIGSVFWNMFKLCVSPPYSTAVFGGALLGYVLYDCTHYYLHHGKTMKGVSLELKRNHLNHHFRNQNKGFGVTSVLWDWVFRTLPPQNGKNV